MIQLAYTNIAQWLSDTNKYNFKKELPTHLLSHVLSYKKKADQIRSASGYLLLKQLVFQSDTTLEKLLEKVVFLEKGKPIFTFDDICFSIAHSGDYVVVVISTDFIGVDVEKQRVMNKELFDKYFSKEESDFFSTSTSPFFDLWTIKEAACKLCGEGISILEKVKVIGKNKVEVGQNNSYYISFSFLEGYSISVVSEKKITKDEVEVKELLTDRLFT